MADETPLKCPVCRAAFRSEVICPRCEADLSRIMKTAAKAHLFRQAAFEALDNGEITRSLKLLSLALQLKK